jgi:soluble lytic murein transglycosylase-like protein
MLGDPMQVLDPRWKRCATLLVEMSGVKKIDIDKIVKASISQEDIFLIQLLSLIYVESRFNRLAISDAGAYGYTQITKPAVLDAAAYCGLSKNPKNWYDTNINIKYGSCYLQKLIKETGDWTSALVVYNGGYKQLTKYQKGEQMLPETSNYVLQVLRVEALCN